MLSGRWLFFFGFIWAVTNLLVSGYSASGAGSGTAQIVGFTVTSEELGTLVARAQGDEVVLVDPLDQPEAEAIAGNIWNQLWSVIKNVYGWATWDYAILTGDVWGMVRTVWTVASVIFSIMGLIQLRQLLPFI